ncbi:specificity determinant for hsdM and hsdR [Proteus mirabilis]|nr:restriction endonuclease subunit S [Proteus mirabilis]MDU1884180.1 restriction endonuclease subunit S [Proteus mirabilis]ROD52231.1 specificity determinant for hsdM and hsdR [Proteus mirabilis]HCT6310678.1 restriction endonuclease subunit S [Proteus mirabilis]HEK1830882.1 restriction endonuclease subunit S [Proteus mirabilis]
MNGKIQPENWLSKLAIDCFDQISTIKNKVKSRDCLPKGLYPVIDQGQIFISGYINDKSKLIKVDTPICIFGDHTRIVKWVTYDFVPGADGTKLLQPKAFIHPRYAYYSLCALNIPDKGYSRHFKYFKELEINLPGWVEQKIIAEKLDTLLAQIDSTKARLEQIPQILKRFRQAVLTEAISGELTKHLIQDKKYEVTLDKIASIIDPHPSHRTPKIDDTGIPYIGIGDIQPDGKINFTSARKVSVHVFKEHRARYTLDEGDFIFGKIGTLGKACVLPVGLKYTLSANVILIQPIKDKVSSDFLRYFLSSPLTMQEITRQANSTSQAAFGIKKMRAFKCNLPSLVEQHEIVRRIEQLFAYADTIEKQVNNALSRVNNLTQSILAKAFRGELTAQWRVENPDLISGENSAAALLEKIKAERAASGNKKASRKKK